MLTSYASIAQNLKAHMSRQGMNSRQLARRSSVKPSFIYDILNGKSTNPSAIKMARVAQSLGVSLSQLIEEHYQNWQPTPIGMPANQSYSAIKTLSVRRVEERLQVVESYAGSESSAYLPEGFATRTAQLRLVRVDGDIMAPSFLAGDWLVVDTTQNTPSPPGVFVLFDGITLLPKRLELLQNQIAPEVRILSDNPKYPSYSKRPGELRIVGRVVWFSRRV